MIHLSALNRNGSQRPLELKTLTFPGGEIHASVEAGVDGVDDVLVRAHLSDSAEVMTLLMVTDAVRQAYPGRPIVLDMPYVPYARQDRVANPGEAHSVKVFCQLINAQNYALVGIQDPHSDVVTALLDRVQIQDPLPALREVVGQIFLIARQQPTMVAPDAGARKRVLKLAKETGCDVVYADKVRDTRTGHITGTEIQSELPGGPLLVVDDICDGGRTFIELAAAIREQNYMHPIYLYVTHGIFSKGLDPLLECYDRVFTRNNWTDDSRCVIV
jgi:ribose-phosphate pyrophosphokinase